MKGAPMLLKKFFTAHEAAQWLERKSSEPLQADDVHRLAESGALPVCFRFRGNLGVFDAHSASGSVAQSVAQAVFAPAKHKAFFPAGYLRASGGAQLGVAVKHVVRRQVERMDHLNVGAVTIAQAGRGFAGIEFDSDVEVLWPLRENGSRAMGVCIDSADWLFHVEDLSRLLAFGADVIRAPVDSGSCESPGKADDGEAPRAASLSKWKMRVQAQAAEHWRNLRRCGANPTVHGIVDDIAAWCRNNDVKTGSGIYPSGNYLRTHVLGGRHWRPPD